MKQIYSVQGTTELQRDIIRLEKLRPLKPFKAVIPGYMTERFKDESEAVSFFNGHDGTCLLAFDDGKKYKVLKYKYVCNPAIKLSA